MKVVILCGGLGLRLNNSNEFVPKGMVTIGHRPLLWHLMKIYAQYNVDNFILALGANGRLIRDYFIHYDEHADDLTVTLGNPQLHYHTRHQENGWKITFVETGQDSGTGARLFRCRKHLGDENFMVAYSDCLANVNIARLAAAHKESGRIATVTGVMPPFRYGEFVKVAGEVTEYRSISRLRSPDGWVNGGFMAFTPGIFDYLTPYNECVLEGSVFAGLAKDRQIGVFEHPGFWQCLDNQREYEYLNSLAAKNSEVWLFPGKDAE